MTAEAEISKINDTLKSIKFGRDSYEFIFPKSSQYAAFYDMFKADSISDGRSIFNYDFEQQYNEQLDMLFTSLASDELNSMVQLVNLLIIVHIWIMILRLSMNLVNQCFTQRYLKKNPEVKLRFHSM